MLQRLYDWTMSLAAHRHAEWALAFIAFLESSVFPIPPDVMLMPMVLARRERAWRYATLCTIASLVGAAAGYSLGYFAFEAIGKPIFEAYGYLDKFYEFQQAFNTYGSWLVFIFGISFFPFKVITIASGVTKLNFLVFLAAAALSRALRFYLVAGLLWKFGAPIRTFIERRLTLLVTLFVLLLIGGFALITYL